MSARVLVLAGLDPSGGAGLLADAEAIRASGATPLCCATAITVQSGRGVRQVHPLSAALVLAQARALVEDEAPIGAVKLGMLGDAAIARAIATLKDEPSLQGVPWVIDPVLHASSGAALFDDARAYDALLSSLAILTPNLAEAATLSGRAVPRTLDEMEACARVLLARGAGAVLVKGGHREDDATDLLVEVTRVEALRASRQNGARRGTGCRLASHLAAELARGRDLSTATHAAKARVSRYLAEL